jgi:dCTP diphosphatase
MDDEARDRLVDIKGLQARLARFAEQRDWGQFHSPKNLAMALAGEVGELLEVFQWLTEEESRHLGPAALKDATAELADIQIYVSRLADVGAYTFFDLDCTRGEENLHVEVKGTISDGAKVLLTQNEVAHAKAGEAPIALFVVSAIQLTRTKEDGVSAAGGRERVLWPREIDQGTLKPVGYEYELPSDG